MKEHDEPDVVEAARFPDLEGFHEAIAPTWAKHPEWTLRQVVLAVFGVDLAERTGDAG